MVMIDPALFQSEWFVNLPVDDRYMYLYILVNADCKIGAIEWNERMINFCANCTKHFTKEDIIRSFGGRIQAIPGHDNTLIVVDYLRFNWLKNGKELDPHNPLHKSIIARLASFDLTPEKLNEMSSHKIKVVVDDTPPKVEKPACAKLFDDSELETMFGQFWESYPSCSRKANRKKVHDKFVSLILDTGDKAKANVLYASIMTGLSQWRSSPDWTKDGGQYICAPLVWLNQARWEATIRKGTTNGNQQRNCVSNQNCRIEDNTLAFG